jgi:hypothetical protein
MCLSSSRVKKGGREYLLRCSSLEIYNETIFVLLGGWNQVGTQVAGTNNIILMEGPPRQIGSRGAVGVIAFSHSLLSRENVGPDRRTKGTEVCPLRLFVGGKLPVGDIHLLEESRRPDLLDRVIMVGQGCSAGMLLSSFRWIEYIIDSI